jgi:hypothetical protein
MDRGRQVALQLGLLESILSFSHGDDAAAYRVSHE